MQGALVKIFGYSVRTSNSGRLEMTTRYHMEFGVSEQGWEVFEKLQNLWGGCLLLQCLQDAFRSGSSMEGCRPPKRSLNGVLWIKDANNNPCMSSVCFLRRPKSREVGDMSF